MKTNETMIKDYKTPVTIVHEIECEGIFCYSPGAGSEDYGGIPENDSF